MGQLVDPRQMFPWALMPHHSYIQSLAHIQLRIMLDQQQLQQQQQLQAAQAQAQAQQQQQLHHLQHVAQPQLAAAAQAAAARWPPPSLLGAADSRRLPESVSPTVNQGNNIFLKKGFFPLAYFMITIFHYEN